LNEIIESDLQNAKNDIATTSIVLGIMIELRKALENASDSIHLSSDSDSKEPDESGGEIDGHCEPTV
jgi:hypothetical protein